MNQNQSPLPEGLDLLPRLDETRIRLLWCVDSWDGPLNGLAEYDGRKVWFVFHGMDEPGLHYFYRLYLLSGPQITEAELWHSTRGYYDGATQRWVDRDEARHIAAWVSPDLHSQQPIGWFTDGSNPDFYAIHVRSS